MYFFDKNYRINQKLMVGGYLCLFITPTVIAQDADNQSEMEKVTEKWECKWCPYEEDAATQTKMEGGVGYVTNDSFKHGDYTGLYEKGAYLIGNMEYSSVDQEGDSMDAEIYDIGLESREIAASTKQGRTDVDLRYSELPKLNSDSASTPYQGRDNQTLPSNWVTAPNTQGMTELDNSLHQVDISTQRRTFSLGADYHQTKSLSYGLSFQRDTKEGYRSMGLEIGRFGAGIGSAILAVPVDYQTDQGQVRISYNKNRWQARLSYEFSNFKNNVDSVSWDNAFSGPAGVTEGQASLEPDNTMQQFTLSGGYNFSQSTQATALLSVGQLEQNDDFLPYDVNGSVSALPRTSLDGKVNTFTGNLAVNSRLTDNFDLLAQYRQNEQDNDTPRATYDYVVNDDPAAPSTARTNIPYSFRQREILVEGRYRLQRPHNFTLGYAYDNNDRTFQEVETTEQNTIWGTYRNQVSQKWDWYLRLEANERTGDEYTQITEPGFPNENDLLRKYNMADRDRGQAVFAVSYIPKPVLQISFYADYANDDYSNSEVGLKESEQTNYSIDLQYSITQALTFNIDYTVTSIESKQVGGRTTTPPSPNSIWTAENDDKINVAHLGLIYQMMQNKLKLGFDYSYADSDGDISVSTGEPYPTLTSTRQTFKIYGDYNLSERSVLHVQYRYEDYNESNWAIDGVTPDTINNVLSMGEVSPDYNIGVFDVSFRYSF